MIYKSKHRESGFKGAKSSKIKPEKAPGSLQRIQDRPVSSRKESTAERENSDLKGIGIY